MKRRVVVLFGGRSAEHEISCLSARSVIDALDPQRYEVVPVGISKAGTWHLLTGPPALGGGAVLPAVDPVAGSQVALGQESGASTLVAEGGTPREIDVVFPVLHGPFGEDGATQGLLELAGVPYVGSGVLASAVGMDKAIQKVLFEAEGLPVVEWTSVREPEWEEDPEGVEGRTAELGYPVFSKPATLGSSVGVRKVHRPAELRGALEEAFGYARKAVVERSVQGAREIECSVLGNDDPVASIAGEIAPSGHEFYDYAAKYLDPDGARLTIPADLSDATLEEVQRIAIAAFRTIDATGMARVDFFLDTQGALFLNEINTIPGFTSISMYPKLWEASGLRYPDLIDRLVDLAVERHERERKKGTGAGELRGHEPDRRA
ncbi:MAG: D-alanine--D-alanine ligase family protein [Actinomycetota bacterium]